MAWTWDRYRESTTVWHRDERKGRQTADPLARFVAIVDRMFYLAAAAFAICIGALLIA